MASTAETGHAKNVANFQDLIEFVTGYGATYNPSKKSLQLPELITLKASAETNLAEVITKNTAYNNKVNERFTAFSDVRPTATRLVMHYKQQMQAKKQSKMQKVLTEKYKAKNHLHHKPHPTQMHLHQKQILQYNNLTTN